ncbi:MAG: bifunctional (p)ppGpp synthetase/guanosine-3',5'-bis(diphosphate) 3'-pyrophosphohydrolase [Chloroflexota bacterium]|nr:bifunctional (p)ppGpp synthetase/guanosine-3',5'-bis(diphosphate) 3'-pyrophosphohydrolase [Chloroflexota bacterium]
MQTRTAPRHHQAPTEPTLSPPANGATVVATASPVCDADVVAALGRLVAAVKQSTPNANVELIERAADLAIEAHGEDRRKSGEPYVLHPIEVATLLARMQLDAETLAAAVLHDVVEDTPVERERIEQEFGPRVAKLVEGVTKLGRIPWTADDGSTVASREKEHQAESLRKMFLAMVDDIGVVLIKLADRLHNMRTLEALPEPKRKRIAQQTMEIYAPLANRLGIWQFKSELEDLAFRYLDPEAHSAIVGELERRGRDRSGYIERTMAALKHALGEAGVEAEITGRGKHVYSIYRKMRSKGRNFDEIYDVIGIRVLVEDRKDCYGALGVVHAMWHPLPGEFDDYIATPKESMYQSLHTAVIGPEGRALEIQIRTREMHRIAEYGVAAHWRYKEGGKSDARVEAKIAWLRQLMDWRDEVADAEEFVESLKSDVFQEMIYVFTPAGDIIELPARATPVDFAYRIHTEVGHQCVGAKVNDQLVPLNYQLQNGQVVRILTSKTKVGPSRDWLQASSGYVTTASAREKIRQWFRRRERDENIAQGKEILDRELRRLSLDLRPEELLKHFPQYPKVDDLLAAVGYGGVSPQLVAARLDQTREKDVLVAAPHIEVPRSPARLQVMGVGDLLTNLATCCKPVNGDGIIGYVTRGRGITVHRRDCSNVAALPDPERLVPVSWGDRGQETFPVTIRVHAWDRVGFLKDVSTVLADEKVNIVSVLTTTHDDRTVTLLVTVEVEGIGQLSKILQKLEGIRDVYDVRRDAGQASTRAAV